jgi:Zn-dependent protease with chaperone function
MIYRMTPEDRQGTVSPSAGLAPAPDRIQSAREINKAKAGIANAFEGRIDPVPVGPLYGFGIFVVALVMLLLPLLYVALVALTGYALYFHAVTSYAVFGKTHSVYAMLVVYVGPLLAGIILLLFMLKPLFAPGRKTPPPISLDHGQEPLVFALVEKLCTVVGAPMPRRIDVSCEVNASASFRRGIRSFMNQDLVLTIGLPLVGELELRQLVGVLAHELGHFNQGSGMRLTHIVRSVSAWLARVVYERDAWDQKLMSWSTELDFRIGIVLLLARFFVWLTRGILWVLMWTGHVVSCFVLRQMEFDADRYQARVAGSDEFRRTIARLPMLIEAYGKAMETLSKTWVEKQLGDNLPELVVAHVGQIHKEHSERPQEQSRKAKTGLFDTHPAVGDRIANAARENTPGIFRIEGSATLLFMRFRELSRTATLSFYREALDAAVSPENLVSTQRIMEAGAAEEDEERTLKRFFQGALPSTGRYGMSVEQLEREADPATDQEMLRSARNRFESLLQDTRDQARARNEVDQRRRTAMTAKALIRAGLRPDPAAFGIDRPTLASAQAAIDKHTARLRELDADLSERDAALQARLEAGTRLARRSMEPLQKMRMTKEIRAWAMIDAACDQVQATRLELEKVTTLFANIQMHGRSGLVYDTLLEYSRSLARSLYRLRVQLSAAPYPFGDHGEEVSIGDALIDRIPSGDNVAELGQAAENALGTLAHVHSRLTAHLAAAAESAELMLELPPLAESEEPTNNRPTGHRR